MKDFVFIIPLTPSNVQSPFRKELFQLTLLSLKNQTSDNWQAILVGEYEKAEGNLIYIPAVSLDPDYKKVFRSNEAFTDKHFKIDVALQYIAGQSRKPKYLIRLDDDDIFSPVILSKIENLNYDCYVDEYQALYDTASGKILFGKYSWFANTIIHKYEHAAKFIPDQGYEAQPAGALINGRHNIAFHQYYKDKNVFFTSKKNPIYLRVLTSTSLAISHKNDNVKYADWVKTYGYDWYYYRLPEFEPYVEKLIVLFAKYYHVRIKRNFSLLQGLMDSISNAFQKYSYILRCKMKK
jgi:hypothetical protein